MSPATFSSLNEWAYMATPVSSVVLRNLALDVIALYSKEYYNGRGVSVTTVSPLVLRVLVLIAFAVTAEDNAAEATLRSVLPALRQLGISIEYQTPQSDPYCQVALMELADREDTCPICLMEFDGGETAPVRTRCGNACCKGCFLRWLSTDEEGAVRSFGICRTELGPVSRRGWLPDLNLEDAAEEFRDLLRGSEREMADFMREEELVCYLL